MMIFKELVLENFGPYKGKNIINLIPEKGLDNAPIVLFGGMNGGGKTTLMDSIRLALYGKRSDCSNRENLSYNDFLIQCVNNQISLGEKTRIELSFEHIVNDEWIELKIVRYWEKNVKDGKDNLGVIEGEFPDVNLTENWDEYVENFLPLGISNLFLFDGEQVKELAEQDLPTNAVKEAMKSLLGLELADKLILDLDVLINRKDKISDQEIADQNFLDLEGELLVLEEQKKTLLEELSIQEKNLKLANKSYLQASNNLKNEGGKVAAEKYKLHDKQKSLENEIENIYSELRYLASQSFPLILITDLLNSLKIELQEESKLLKIKNAQGLWEEKDQKLLSFLQNLDIDNYKYSQIKDFLQSESLFLQQQLKGDKIYLNAEDVTLPKLDNILQNLLPTQQVQVQEKLSKLAQLENQLIMIEETIIRVDSPEAYKNLEREYRNEEKALIQIKIKCETIKQTLNAVEKKIADVRKKLSNYGENNLKNLQVQHIVEMMPKVKQTLSLFKHKLTLRKLNKLELEVTNCFRYLLHKSHFVAKVAIDADSFALSIYDHQGLVIPKNRLSAGEKQLLAIALLWGLARVSGKNLPIAIDTPLGRLDSSHRYNLIERYFPTASHQVILLSTDTEIGKSEVNFLREKQAIAREYLLDYDSKTNQTRVKSGYFF
ncbi:DNA sulfur modification protein DndD [Geminocystis sp. GBBB08]|uniref:DNA sulfur modification protein DndD n=1 Tax=Geminocystis sp. GBBB08 TaxID=2604140 RepID=UPI0027E2A8A1|nr:DNA sulfur modification protein DndD [Geminocystis sp. GBBB08]MBL1209456.1 DNA sulfur modification protein DndD [Geminocystis sp. GBBB08]